MIIQVGSIPACITSFNNKGVMMPTGISEKRYMCDCGNTYIRQYKDKRNCCHKCRQRAYAKTPARIAKGKIWYTANFVFKPTRPAKTSEEKRLTAYKCSQRSRAELQDSYINLCLNRKYESLPLKDIPKELIELKRAQMTLSRKLIEVS